MRRAFRCADGKAYLFLRATKGGRHVLRIVTIARQGPRIDRGALAACAVT